MVSMSNKAQILGAIRIGAVCLALFSFLWIRAVWQSTTSSTPNHSLAKALSQTNDIPPCSAGSAPSPTNQTASPSNQPPHTVTLTWNASVPASGAGRDAVKGYFVYRNSSSEQTFSDSDQMNAVPLQGTRCIDRAVQPKGIYHYAVKAVTENGAKSGYSKPITVTIPSP